MYVSSMIIICIVFNRTQGLKRNRTERNVKSFDFFEFGFHCLCMYKYAHFVSKECMWLCNSAEKINTKLKRTSFDRWFTYAVVGKWGEKVRSVFFFLLVVNTIHIMSFNNLFYLFRYRQERGNNCTKSHNSYIRFRGN